MRAPHIIIFDLSRLKKRRQSETVLNNTTQKHILIHLQKAKFILKGKVHVVSVHVKKAYGGVEL
jgi:hypothetical protein